MSKAQSYHQTKQGVNHLNNIVTAPERKQHTQTRLHRNSKLFKTIINAIQDKKGESVIALDLRKIDEAVADFFILCDARSNTQVAAIAGNIIEKIAEECGEKPYHSEMGDKWTIIDFANVVVHVFQHEQRLFYNLEGLWEDAHKTEY